MDTFQSVLDDSMNAVNNIREALFVFRDRDRVDTLRDKLDDVVELIAQMQE